MYESKREYKYGTGRRKSSVARVRLYQGGTGAITINGLATGTTNMTVYASSGVRATCEVYVVDK